jgi:hypothetical protein
VQIKEMDQPMRPRPRTVVTSTLTFLVVLLTTATVLHAQAPYTFTKIVETGTVGSNGQTIVLCNYNIPVTINSSGTVAFSVANSGGVGLCQSGNGLQSDWSGDGGTPRLIYPLDGQGVNGVGPGDIDDSGNVTFLTRNPNATGAADGTLLYVGNGGQPTLIAVGPFSSSFVSSNNSGAAAVLGQDLPGPYEILRVDAPGAIPVVIDQDPQNSLYPWTSINASGLIAFTRALPVHEIRRGSGGAVTTIAQAGMTVNGRVLDQLGQYVSIRDDGFVAFDAINLQQGGGIYVGDGNQVSLVVDTQDPSPFQDVRNPTLNNTGKFAFWGELKLGQPQPCPFGACIGLYTGADPETDKVIQSGDVLDGMTVVDTDNSWPPAMNDNGQIAFGVRLMDANGGLHFAVYRADPSNHPPVLAAIGNKAAAELSTLSFTATASDPDAGDSLTFSLDAGAPTGAAISSAGVFSWTPTEAQGPGTYAVGIRVSDNGTPVESDGEVISVQVSEVNSAPVLAPIGNKTVKQGSTLTFTASASDSDLPKNTLGFSLAAGAPAGATINSSTGAFSWKPSNKQGAGSYPVTIRVTDNGSPALSASASITITVTKKGGKP